MLQHRQRRPLRRTGEETSSDRALRDGMPLSSPSYVDYSPRRPPSKDGGASPTLERPPPVRPGTIPSRDDSSTSAKAWLGRKAGWTLLDPIWEVGWPVSGLPSSRRPRFNDNGSVQSNTIRSTSERASGRWWRKGRTDKQQGTGTRGTPFVSKWVGRVPPPLTYPSFVRAGRQQLHE